MLFDQRRDYKLVKKSAKKAVYRAIEIDKELSARPFPSPVACKTLIPIDRAGRNGRKEKQEHQQIERAGRNDHLVSEAKHDIKCAKCDVGDAEKTELTSG